MVRAPRVDTVQIPAHPHPQEVLCPLAQLCMFPAPGVAMHVTSPSKTTSPQPISLHPTV